MVSAFVSDVSGGKEPFVTISLDLGKQPRHVFDPVDRDDKLGIEEEIAVSVAAVQARGLKKHAILLLFKQRIIFRRKRVKRGKRPDVADKLFQQDNLLRQCISRHVEAAKIDAAC